MHCFVIPHQNNNYERTYKTDNKQPDQIDLFSQIWVYTASPGMCSRILKVLKYFDR